MTARIGSHPTTDPNWIDKQVANNQEPTAEELKIANRQADAMGKTLDTLNRPIQKGDMKSARAKEADLKEQFKNLSTEDKQFMYNVLQDKNGMADTFQYRLATASRERLLKTLNPEHVTPQRLQEKIMRDAKASKTNELNATGASRQHQLQNFKDPASSSAPLGGKDFQNKLNNESGIPSTPLGGKDFQDKLNNKSEFPSVPLGGKDFQNKLNNESGIPSTPLGGKDFQDKLNDKLEFPSVPLGGKDFQNKLNNESGIPSTPLGGKDFQDKLNDKLEFPSVPLGGKDFRNKLNNESGIPSVPLGGKDFQNKLELEIPSAPISVKNQK